MFYWKTKYPTAYCLKLCYFVFIQKVATFVSRRIIISIGTIDLGFASTKKKWFTGPNIL